MQMPPEKWNEIKWTFLMHQTVTAHTTHIKVKLILQTISTWRYMHCHLLKHHRACNTIHLISKTNPTLLFEQAETSTAAELIWKIFGFICSFAFIFNNLIRLFDRLMFHFDYIYFFIFSIRSWSVGKINTEKKWMKKAFNQIFPTFYWLVL